MPVARYCDLSWFMLSAPLRLAVAAAVDRAPLSAVEHDAVVALRRVSGEYSLRAHRQARAPAVARERIAVAAAAGRIEPENVAALAADNRHSASAGAWRWSLSGLIHDVAGAAVAAAGAAVRRNDVLHRADREARVGEIEIFAPDAEAAAECAGAAGIADQLEAQHAGREFALDDLDRRDPGIALVDGDAGGAVLGGARAAAAGDDLVLHIALAGRRCCGRRE